MESSTGRYSGNRRARRPDSRSSCTRKPGARQIAVPPSATVQIVSPLLVIRLPVTRTVAGLPLRSTKCHSVAKGIVHVAQTLVAGELRQLLRPVEFFQIGMRAAQHMPPGREVATDQ